MGAALNTAAGMSAYIMSDRASWLNFGNMADLALIYAGDPEFFNQYAFLPVNPQKHPHSKADLAAELEAWLVSDTAEDLISGYKINGETLFFSMPNSAIFTSRSLVSRPEVSKPIGVSTVMELAPSLIDDQ